ncbi:MAG: TetR/AcrR family transcriptional regulator [Mycobacterium sp.]|nr:TetR/AcrR family transcriptional regulator [Mycobacterium sp.]
MTETSWAPAKRRGRPPSSDSAATRERILQAAQKVFAESGYEAATFQAVAVEVGLTRPAINNYFHSKSDLYAAVVRRVGDAVLDAIHIASEASTLAGQVLTFIRLAGRDGGADPSLARFLVQSAIDVEHLPHGQGEAAALIERFIRAAVGAAVHRGEINQVPEGLTDLLMGLVLGMAYQQGRSDDAGTDRMLDQLRVVLEDGLTA